MKEPQRTNTDEPRLEEINPIDDQTADQATGGHSQGDSAFIYVYAVVYKCLTCGQGYTEATMKQVHGGCVNCGGTSFKSGLQMTPIKPEPLL